jgi:hypothetical protein
MSLWTPLRACLLWHVYARKRRGRARAEARRCTATAALPQEVHAQFTPEGGKHKQTLHNGECLNAAAISPTADWELKVREHARCWCPCPDCRTHITAWVAAVTLCNPRSCAALMSRCRSTGSWRKAAGLQASWALVDSRAAAWGAYACRSHLQPPPTQIPATFHSTASTSGHGVRGPWLTTQVRHRLGEL